MSREIHDHKINGLNEALSVVALDDPGSGGASHAYAIYVPDRVVLSPGVTIYQTLAFQNGPIASPADINGISNEALLAVLIDRLRGFQHGRMLVADPKATVPSWTPAPMIETGEFDFSTRGPFACRENACALTHLEEALMWLQKRTRDRMARGVEGTLKP